jgi:long-chain acyl-CoA synthetase
LNFTQLIHRTARHSPSNVAVVTDDQTLSYADFWRNIASAGQFYLDSSVRAGDKVLLVLPNSPDFLHMHFGALKIGAISVPVRADYTGWEVRRIAQSCEPALMISTSGWLERNGAELQGILGNRIRSLEEIKPWPQPGADEAATVSSHALASINYSYSGGGYAKGAMLTHANHIYAATGYARHQGFRSSDRLLIVLPMCHVYALSGCVNAGLARGAGLVLSGHHMPRGILSDIERHRATIVSLVPAMFECLAAYGRKDRFDLSSLRRLVTGGAYMSSDSQHEVEQAFGVEMVQGYGLTECLPVICNPPGVGNRRGTLGVPGRRDIWIRIMGPGGQTVLPEVIGEIEIRSTTTMVGYYGLPEDTKAVFNGEWLRTGDLGWLDAEGYLHFERMIKPIANLNGNKADLKEIREVILDHPAVARVEVTTEANGSTDRMEEIKICAQVTLRPNATVTSAASLREFCAERLAAYKIPHIKVLGYDESEPVRHSGETVSVDR